VSATTVQTVTGPVPLEALGRVLMHEHVITRSPGLREAGVATIVDHTTYDLGRDAELLAEVSAASGVHIVAATGVWIEPQRYWHERAPAEAARLLIGDIEDGIAGTDVKAGVIKCAIDRAGPTPAVERVLRACAIAHRETGVHLSTHTHAAARNGLDQQRVFGEEGVDLRRVVIGHCGDTTDLDYLRELLASGSFLGLDRFGVEDLLADELRMDVVATLCRDGHAGRLLLSQDASFWNDRTPMAEVRRKRPAWHHRHVIEVIVPGLLRRGVTQREVDTMFIHNPRAVFADVSRYPGEPSAAARRNAWD
jgi:phosphotriesterase-related protein